MSPSEAGSIKIERLILKDSYTVGAEVQPLVELENSNEDENHIEHVQGKINLLYQEN